MSKFYKKGEYRKLNETEITELLANTPSPAGVDGLEVIGWYTDDHLDDKSATTYSWAVAERWVEKGWPVSPLYAAPVSEAKAQGVVMPEHETSTPSSKWASAGESDPHGKAYDCERAELSMGEYTDDELANAVFMHDHRSFDIAATMRGEPGSIVLLTAAKDRIRWLSRSLDKALACLNAAPVRQPKCKTCDDNGRLSPRDSSEPVDLEERILYVAFDVLLSPEGNPSTTICRIYITPTFSVMGHSNVLDHANYNEQLGNHFAYLDAFDKLWDYVAVIKHFTQ